MVDIEYETYEDRFTNLASGPSATMLVLLVSLGIQKGDTLYIYEIDSLGVRTGNYGFGTVEKIASGQFYNLPDIYNQYYINPFTLPTWTDYSAVSTVTGWSGTPTKNIWYIKVGSTVYWMATINGTANSSAKSFTLPYSASVNQMSMFTPSRNTIGGIGTNIVGSVRVQASSNVLTCFRDMQNTTYPVAGGLVIIAEGFFQV